MRAILIAALIEAFAAPLSAWDYFKGDAAFKSGDYATALKEWKPLAEQGDEFAQSNLGIIYENGIGVPQDYKEAVKWYRLHKQQDSVERCLLNEGVIKL